MYIVALESVHLIDQICICTVSMANEWKKMLIHYWIFLFLFFFWIQLVPGLKTSIYVHDSEDFFLMSTFFLINCWKTSWLSFQVSGLL